MSATVVQFPRHDSVVVAFPVGVPSGWDVGVVVPLGWLFPDPRAWR